jgi:signal transduction histidine kinase
MRANPKAPEPLTPERTGERLLLIVSIGLSFALAVLSFTSGRETRSAIGASLSVVVVLTSGAILTNWVLRTHARLRNAHQQTAMLSERLEGMAGTLNLASAMLEEERSTHRALTCQVRHDLISPLGSISGFLELLRDCKHGELSARQLSFVQNMERSVGSLLKVAEQMAEETSVAATQRKPAPKASDELLQELDNEEWPKRA